MTREICKRCLRPSAVGFTVSDDVWEAVVHDRWNVLCVGCFTTLGDEQGVKWDRQIEFHPVSLVTHLRRCARRQPHAAHGTCPGKDVPPPMAARTTTERTA